MHVKFLDPSSENAGLNHRAISDLIASIGTERFESAFAATLASVSKSDIVNACYVSSDREMQRVLAAIGSKQSCHRVDRFMKSYWDADPANDPQILPHVHNGGVSMMHLSRGDMQLLPYRRKLYSSTDWSSIGEQLLERVTLTRHTESGNFRLAMYRTRERPFTSRDLSELAIISTVLFASVDKHLSSHQLHTPQMNKQDHYMHVLECSAPFLSRREKDVCVGIAMGRSSEGIALHLGISLNTVLTHRKNAYTKLNISSQNQLFTFIFDQTAPRSVQML